MKFQHRKLAERFENIMRRAGATLHVHWAQTGTIYVTVDDIFKVRFADHGECYCTEDIDVSPDGCTLEVAVRAAAEACDLDVARSLASFKAARTKETRRREAEEARLAPIIAARRHYEEKRIAFQKVYIANNYPDYANYSTKSRSRIREKANKLYRSQQ